MKMHKNFVISILSAIILVIVIAVGFSMLNPKTAMHGNNTVNIDGLYLNPPRAIANFQLTNIDHKPFTNENLKGHWTMMFFGFTNCGYVCPTTMAALSQMYQGLTKELDKKQLPQVVMVSIDPDRDTLAKLKTYVKAFNPNFTGARSSMKNTEALEKQLHIIAEKVRLDDKKKANYTMDHSAEIIVFNPQGNVQAYMSFPHKPEQMIKDYKLVLANAG